MRTADDILAELRSLANPENVAGMARYGISVAGTLGVSVPTLRGIATTLRPARRSEPAAVHALAERLWASQVHEARMLAGFIDVPGLVTREQMEEWAGDFDSWDICDQVCSNLFDKTPFAWEKAVEWSGRDEEFVKRAGFVLACALAVHDKKAPDEPFLEFLVLVEREAGDERNFVKKAVNWALRQIGKRDAALNEAAIGVARRLANSESKAARWVAADALRELTSLPVRTRLGLPG
jgi:3-methyladenine DNA glycosylase AlkD